MAYMAALMIFAGCSTESDEPKQEPASISLLCSTAPSMAADTRAGANEHDNILGEQVNVYMPGTTALNTAIVYTVGSTKDAEGWTPMTTASSVYLYTDETPVYSLYPTAAIMAEGEVSFSVNSDQSSSAGYNASDLLFAKTSINKNTASEHTLTTRLHFHHLMAKVIVNVDYDNTIMNVTGIWLNNVNQTVSFTPSDYSIDHESLTGLATSNPADESDNGIKAGTASGCCALIPAQTFTEGNLITIEATSADGHYKGMVSYYNTPDKKITFYPGRTYTINLKVEKWVFGQILTIAVSNWDYTEDLEEPYLSI